MKKMQIRKPLSPAAGILALTILISFGGCASNPGNEQKAEHTESSVTTGAAQQSGSGDLSSPEKSAGTAESTNDDSVSSNTNAVDMTVRDENPEYGVIYYTPSDVKHIAKSDDSSIEYVDNEILIVANENAARDDIAGLAEKYNAEIVGEIEVTGDYQLKLNKTCTMKELDKLADELESDALVDRAYPNYVTGMSSESVTSSPPDGLNYGDAWRKDIQKYDGKGLSWGWEAIHTNEAWEYLSENEDKVNKDLRLGLIDSGFYLDWDLEFAATFYDNGNNGENQTNEEREHGTHVAGTMAAISDNERGICGVYPYGKGNLYGVRSPSYGDNVRNSENEKLIIADKIALAELIIRNVKVINISMGYIDENIVKIELKDELHTSDAFIELCCVIMPDIIGDYLQRFIDKGYDFVIVNASGNTSNSKEYDKKIIVNDKNIETNWIKTKYTSEICGIDKEKYPDVYNRIIVVGSVNEKLELSRFCNIGERVDVYAPGENIYSIIPQQKYGKNQGTSMASPHVAGVAAMVWAANSSLTGAEVKSIVCVSGIYARDYGFTFGIPKQLNPDSSNQRAYFVNAAAAVNMALNSLGSRRKTAPESKPESKLESKPETEPETNSETNSETKPESEPENGAILCWVVDKKYEDKKLEGAIIEAADENDNSKVYNTTSDGYGHFELILPEGKYTLTVKLDHYQDYVKTGVQVTNEGVNYLDDWIKMEPTIEYTEFSGKFYLYHVKIGYYDIYLDDSGYFTSKFHYDNPWASEHTIIQSEFQGRFSSPKKINDYTYSFEVEWGQSAYENEKVKEDNVIYDRRESDIKVGSEFRIYTRDTPESILPKTILGIKESVESDRTLYMQNTDYSYILYDVSNDRPYFREK